MDDKPMTYWTLVGKKIENMAVVPLVMGVSIHNTIRKRHEARMERGKRKNKDGNGNTS